MSWSGATVIVIYSSLWDTDLPRYTQICFLKVSNTLRFIPGSGPELINAILKVCVHPVARFHIQQGSFVSYSKGKFLYDREVGSHRIERQDVSSSTVCSLPSVSIASIVRQGVWKYDVIGWHFLRQPDPAG